MKSLAIAIAALSLIPAISHAAPPPTRPPTAPGTPALVAAGPDAEERAKAAASRPPSDTDAASNPTEAPTGANPPANLDGNFLIGPEYVHAPESTVVEGVPKGRVEQFELDSADSKFYP